MAGMKLLFHVREVRSSNGIKQVKSQAAVREDDAEPHGADYG